MFNKKKFRASVIAAGFNMDAIAEQLNINPATLYRKINGSSDFTRTEIKELQKILSLNINDTMEIFFA